MRSRSRTHSVYVLHTRRYRETSLLAEVFSQEEGRFSIVVRGARSSKTRPASLLQPFSPVEVAAWGGGDLKTAGHIEASGPVRTLAGESLLIGMYVNELLYRVVGKYEPLPDLFASYERLLNLLASPGFELIMLRRFELSLLASLGYGVTFDIDAASGEAIKKGACYEFIPQEGFREIVSRPCTSHVIRGEELLRIARGEHTPNSEKILKRIVRRSIRPLLGDRPLKAVSLFGERGE